MQASEKTLAAIGKQVFETMAFVFEMPGGEGPVGGEETVRATVEFEGPICGSLALTLPRKLLPEMVVNMLGEDEGASLPEQTLHDAVGELANVICGNLVQAIAGPQPVFRLTSPRIEINPDAAVLAPSAGAATSAWLTLESGWAQLTLIIEEPAAAAATPSACIPVAHAR